MKKRFTILIAALMLLTMMVLPGKAVGQVGVNTVMWSETWTGSTTATSGNNNVTPSANYGHGTTVYNSGTVTYTQSANSVYVRNDTYAGGTAPELMLTGNQTWTISNIPTGGSAQLTLTYKSNNTKSSVTCSTSETSISGSSKSYTIKTNGANTITLVFSCSGNTRIDDVELKVKTLAVTYKANNSTAEADYFEDNNDNGYNNGATVTVLGNNVIGYTAPSGKIFSHWNTQADGKGTSYDPDDTFTISTNTTLYAIWVTPSTPTITVSTDALNGFTYIYNAGPSAAQSFTVSGSNLEDDINISVDNDYELSTNNASWPSTSELTLEIDGDGTVEETTIYIRLKAGLVLGSHNGTVEMTAGVAEAEIALTGSVVNAHTITYSAENGSISGIDAGSAVVASGASIAEGATVTLTATPNTGYKFTGWSVSGTGSLSSTTTNPTTFTMGTGNSTVTATFVENNAYEIDFESALSNYTDWDFTNITSQNTHGSVSGHTGSYFGTTGNNSSASLVTKSTIAAPTSITFYVTKQTTNEKAANWKVEVSNGSSWTQVGDAQDAISMDVGTWVEVTRDLSSYSNVKVRVTYTNTGSGTAVRCIDDLSLSYTPAPKHTLAVSSVDHITIKATVSGSDIAEDLYAQISEGSTVTLSCTGHDDGYRFDAWSVYKTDAPSTTVTVTNNTFEMPSYDVTVSASTVATYTLTYDINGAIYEDVEDEDTDIDPLPTPGEEDTPLETATVPAGYEFVGWTTNKANTSDGDLVTSYNVTANQTFYAVFKKSNKIVLSTGFKTGSYDNNEETRTFGGVDFGVYKVIQSGGIQFQASNGYIYNKDAIDNITTIVTTQTGTKRTFELKGGNTSSNPTDGTTISPSSTDGNVDTYTISGNYKYFRLKITASNAGKFSSIVINLTSDDTRYTRVVPETVTDDITISEPTYIASGSVVDMGSYNITCNNTANLIIEDGAEIILNSANNGVNATFIKNIKSAAKDKDIWYTISTPTGGIKIIDVTNLVDNEGHSLYYNLYRYNEYDATTGGGLWEAYNTTNHPLFTTLEKGRGYLYRNNGMNLSFAGEVNVGDVTGITLTSTEDSDDLRGFNLIGNPFGHTIYKGEDAAIDNTSLNEGFYYLTETGEWIAGNYKTPITPRMGILVQVSSTITSLNLTISDTDAKPSSESKYANDNLQFMVSNNDYEDVAYAIFRKGNGLNKINHRNAEAPMIYIPQDDGNFAIAMMADNTKVFGLNFKAVTMGQYTLSYQAEGNFDYLHVIDRHTGEDIDMLLEGKYTFVATPNDNDNRFIVKLAYKPDYSEGNNDIFAYQSGNEILVSGTGELQIFDVTGRMIMNTNINGAEAVNVPAQGVYIFRLVGNEVKTQKIVVR